MDDQDDMDDFKGHCGRHRPKLAPYLLSKLKRCLIKRRDPRIYLPPGQKRPRSMRRHRLPYRKAIDYLDF